MNTTKLPAWAESDASHPERAAEWSALLDRLDRLEAALAESVAYGCVAHDPHGDSDGDCDRCASLDAAEELLALRSLDAKGGA